MRTEDLSPNNCDCKSCTCSYWWFAVLNLGIVINLELLNSIIAVGKKCYRYSM